MAKEKEYAYYDRNDEFVGIGTKKELAELAGVKVSTIQFYLSPTHRKRTGGKGVCIVSLDDEGEENE